MKKPGIFLGGKCSLHHSLPVTLAVMALIVTGCPHNQYIVELKPRGVHIERSLVFYRKDGVNTNSGVPNYQAFDTDELAAIAAQYPKHGLTNNGDRHFIRGEFTSALPNDVGGSGAYTNLITSLGQAGFYEERFRGNDDLVGISERRAKAAEQLADLALGWSQMELGQEPGYAKLRQFLDVDFRHDLKNFGAYWWTGQLAGGYKTNAGVEFVIRFGQYLIERGYFTIGDIPGLLSSASGDDSQAIFHRIQRLVARKMGVSETEPLLASLAFLADETLMEKSLDKYLTGTDLYRAKLKQWEAVKKLKPDLEQPRAAELASDAIDRLIDFELFNEGDHLVVRLSLPAAPDHSNGQWNETLKQVVWDSDIPDRTNATHLPISCYASWSQANEAFQTEHLGKVAMIGDDLTQYCIWRSSLGAHWGSEWDAFLAGLKPDAALVERIDAFRFSGEPAPSRTNGQQNAANSSALPRGLLKSAVK